MDPDLYQGDDENEVLLHLFPVIHMHNRNIESISFVHFEHQKQMRDWVLNHMMDTILDQERLEASFVPRNTSTFVSNDVEWFKSLCNPLIYWDSCRLKMLKAEMLPWLSELCFVDKHSEKKTGGQSNGRMTRRSAK